MRVLCVISTMGPGGAEREMARLAVALAEHHHVELMTLEVPGTDPFFALSPAVGLRHLNQLHRSDRNRLLAILRRLKGLRHAIRDARPDVVISFIDRMNISVLIAMMGLRIPLVISERVDPTRYSIGTARNWMRRRLYQRAQACVVQTETVAAYYRRLPGVNVVVIPNSIACGSRAARPDVAATDDRYRIVSAGRLAPQKGFDILIDAFSRLARTHPQWDLVIFGEGSERSRLEARVRDLELVDRISLPGVVRDLDERLAAAHILAFPSRFEGFPNALAEGLAAGLPAVAHVGISGVKELIVSERTGLLVPMEDVGAFAEALKRLIGDPALRLKLGGAARVHIRRWAPSAIYMQWENLLFAVTCRTGLTSKADRQ